MSSYYAISSWNHNEEAILVKLKSTKHDIIEIFNIDGKLDISPYVDKILINKAPSIMFYKIFSLNTDSNTFLNEPSAIYWNGKYAEVLSMDPIILFSETGDAIGKFDSDDDARLWFEMRY